MFDEVHFGKFISGYFTHEYFFDIHPPLGKLLISGMGYITGFRPDFSFAEIGQKFPDRNYLWLRLLPTLAGALLPIVIFFLVLELGLSPLAAFAGGLMVVLENALLVQSRFILLDPFLLLFGFTALLCYFKYKNFHDSLPYAAEPSGFRLTTHYSLYFLLFSGLFAALAASVKWTGATFLAVIIIMEIVNYRLKIRSYLKTIIARVALFLVVIPFIVYFAIFALHFSLLTKSGPGDAFMTPEFRKTLAGSAENQNPDLAAQPLSMWGKFVELNKQMYKSNATLTATHPYSSKWYTWPFMIRPIYYWNKASANNQPSTVNSQPATSNKISRIYFLGNPVIWWASTVAMLYLLLNVLHGLYRGVRPKFLPALLIGAYLLNILPFIGISRAMFLYHYFTALVFAIIALVYLIDQIQDPKTLPIGSVRAGKKRIFTILLAVSVASFIFFAPLTYGLPLSEKAYNFRVWLKTWL